jgi:outer membrane lipoprotein-sorting protein
MSSVSRAALALFFLAQSAHAQTSAQLIARVDAVYAHVTTYQSPFTQTFHAHAYNTTKVERGTLSVVRPSQMSFAYQNGNTIRVNGTTVTAVVGGQQTTQTIATTTFPALSFLTGNGSLASSFTFTDPPSPFQGGLILVGTPVQPTSQYTKALFYVDSQTAHVRRITLIDAQRNTNTFDL